MTSTESESSSVLLRGVRPYGEGEPVDLLVADGRIAALDTAVDAGRAEVVDATGLVALPGFVDLHTHLREPGREDAETIDTGSASAALGGYTAVFAMANTDPVADNAVLVEHVWRRGREVGLVDVHPVGAVTVGLAGERLAELGGMARSAARVRMFSDDGVCVDDPLLMRRALEYSSALGAVIAQHAEEPRLTVGAQAHEGERAALLGLAGWPAAAEESIVARDCLLAHRTGGRLHVCHVSTAGTVEVLRWAAGPLAALPSQAPGGRPGRVSAEVTPHHLLLTDERLTTYDPVNKVNPPLRTEADTLALRAALADGVIDCVATDHAPHAPQDKDCEWAAARPGMLGLETALSVVVETMVNTGLLDWRGVARVMSERPAELVGLPDHGRPIAVGEPASLVLIDPAAHWTVRGAESASLADNTPFEGMRLPARVVATMLRGRFTARDGKVLRWIDSC
ncbi:dihydroorotase [Actinoalloteichus hoggarensis]|uniref:Dihydroorotase n=1 Tax=Actinoalloteichus hoggarensis TaxID=1470176 RepID=A0A221W2D3_9PSEU|nr:dihydroorotase [Actinoalloteichus hoggarensis]ASO19942.1 Dihydroorotase [Actinoalloteichus hoggarensis]MBB5919348.1 dihydroorotase [Actinoalloteichus hoggarensis]